MNEMYAFAEDFGNYLVKTVGHYGYLLGTRGQRITRGMITARLESENYRRYWSTISTYAPKWLVGNPDKDIDNKDEWIVVDCQGWLDAFWNGVDLGKPIILPAVFPDTSTYTQYDLAIAQDLPMGAIETLPQNCPYPLAVCFTGHVGFYYQGMVYQAAGTRWGTIITDLQDASKNGGVRWTHWYVIPHLDYKGWKPDKEVSDVLQKGMKGMNVQAWQKRLMQWDKNALPRFKADGDFGAETETWTNTFKKVVSLPENGMVDDITWDAMLSLLLAAAPSISQADMDIVISQRDRAEQELTVMANKYVVVRNAAERAADSMQNILDFSLQYGTMADDET